MDEGRLKEVRKCQNLHRKYAYALNDTIRNRQNVYEHCLAMEEQESQKYLMSKVIRMRRAVVRSKVLMQCLNFQKQQPLDRMHSEPTLGRYGGRPIASYSRDIDQQLAWHHPTLRRLRKVDRVRQSCLRHGGILEESEVREKMADFFARNLPEPSPEPRLSPINGKPRRPAADDDDDFDMRDFHDPLSGAAIELKLHPFGNNADLNMGVRNGQRKKSPTKRDIFGYRNSILNKDLKEREGKTNENNDIPENAAIDKALENNQLEENNLENASTTNPHSKTIFSVNEKPSKPIKYSTPLPSISVTAPKIEKPTPSPKTKSHKSNRSSNDNPVKLRMSNDQYKNNELNDLGTNSNSEKATDEGNHDDRSTLSRRKTLILPPIETTKDMAKKN